MSTATAEKSCYSNWIVITFILLAAAATSVCRFRPDAFPAACRVSGMGVVLDQCIGPKNGNYVASCRDDIGRNLPSVDCKPTNRRETERF